MPGYEHGKLNALQAKANALRTEIAALETQREEHINELRNSRRATQELLAQEASTRSQLQHQQREARRLEKANDNAQTALETTRQRIEELAAQEKAAINRRTERYKARGVSDEAYAAYDWAMRKYPDNALRGPKRLKEATREADEHGLLTTAA